MSIPADARASGSPAGRSNSRVERFKPVITGRASWVAAIFRSFSNQSIIVLYRLNQQSAGGLADSEWLMTVFRGTRGLDSLSGSGRSTAGVGEKSARRAFVLARSAGFS